MWLGYNSGHFWFRVPDYYEEKQTDFKIDELGQKWRRMGIYAGLPIWIFPNGMSHWICIKNIRQMSF